MQRRGLRQVVENYATHKTPAVKRWLKAHPRFHLHFTPTLGFLVQMVERFFAEITRNRIRRGVFKSVAELKSAVMEYLENHNADPKALHLDQVAGEILEKVAPAKQALRVTILVYQSKNERPCDHERERGHGCQLRCPLGE